MASMQAIDTRPAILDEDDVFQLVAVRALRALAGQPQSLRNVGFVPLPPCQDLARAQTAFEAYREAARTGSGSRLPDIGPSGSQAFTKDERRLLRALAASQACDRVLLDNYLYKLALDRTCRAYLADAVNSLAAALLTVGIRPGGRIGSVVGAQFVSPNTVTVPAAGA